MKKTTLSKTSKRAHAKASAKRKPVKAAAKKAAPKKVSLKKGRKFSEYENRSVGPIEEAPKAQPMPPEGTGGMSKRQAVPAVSVSSKKTDLESEIILSNPAVYGQKVMPVSSASAANGYLNIKDASLYDLFDEMYDRDPIIASCVDLKVAYLLMRSHGLVLDDKAEKDPAALGINKWVQAALCEHPRFNYLLWTLALGTILHGRSNIELTYDVTPDDYFAPTGFWHCHPGQFSYNRKGEMFLVTSRWDKKSVQPVKPKKFISSLNPALYDNPHGKSDLMPVRFVYFFKKKGWVNYVRVVEKNGVPIIHIEIPENCDNVDDVRKSLEQALAMMLEDDALITAAGEKVTVKERGASTAETFYNGLFDRADSSACRQILGAELTSTVQDRGARSLGEVHERTVLTKVLTLARQVEEAINCLIRWLVEWNFGPGAYCPRYVFDTEESQTTENAMKLLVTAKALGIRVAVEQAREWLGLRAPEPGEETITIGNLGVNGKGELTINEKEGAIATDSEEAKAKNKQAEEDPETAEEYTVEHLDRAMTAFSAYMNDPERKAFASLFTAKGPVAVAFRQVFADRGKARASELDRRLLKIAAAAAEDSRPGLEAMVKDLRKSVAEQNRDHGAPLSLHRTKALVDPRKLQPYCEKEAAHVVNSSSLLSLYYTALSLNEVREARKSNGASFADESFLDMLPEGFKAAAEWMTDRGVMTVAAIQELARVIAETYGLGDVKEVERGLRSEILALSKTTTTDGTRQVQSMIADSVEKGLSVGQFLESIDEAFGEDAMPGALDGYWNMVFRTEVGNAYSEQQAQNEKRPEFQDNLWGHEGYNPADDRSRKVHRRVNDKRFQKNSRASRLLGRPPFAYQCRCALFALMAPGGRASYRESPDALDIATSIERFRAEGGACSFCGAQAKERKLARLTPA